MMAFERTPRDSALDAATVADLRAALVRSLEDRNHPEDLGDILLRASAEARSKGLQAEQLLVVLKDIWYSLPQLSTHPSDDGQTRLLQQLIARCIQQYYAG